ncbi:MAG: DUF349 domain-containing protein [Flavobacteriaceae bacterium]|nr:DUF349 domain-containing protein [Flavobacteriaceae bacterium]
MSDIDNLQDAEGKQEQIPNKNEQSSTENQAIEPIASSEEETTLEEVTESEATSEEEKEAVQEIEDANAEDAEDENNAKRHEIPVKDYTTLTMEGLYAELESLIKDQEVQTIKDHVEQISKAFNEKFSALLDEKKQQFLDEGGNSIDFYFSFPLKPKFNRALSDYKIKRKNYYQNIQQSLKLNLERRNTIIAEIKELIASINGEANIRSVYNQFKEYQKIWKNAGPIPRDKYNHTWNNYHHYVEQFYEILHLDRDLRDRDFQHNLEEKQKIIARAKALAELDDVEKSFRELQSLHKIWKEDIGPVSKDHREEIWSEFSQATKVIHGKRQEHFKSLEKVYEKNLEIKNNIISQITTISQEQVSRHNQWQQQIKKIEALREQFFNAGKVPLKVNEQTWASFKDAVRTFNKNKNAFYKDLKKDQLTNLNKKLELIEIANANKDSDDYSVVTPLMKKIQADWKKIGHVPRKDSDRIWKEFKEACNHYFDRLHAKRNEANEEEIKALQEKEAYIETLKDVTLVGEPQEKLNAIKGHIAHWKNLGNVPRNKRQINDDFNKAIDGLFNQLDIDKKEAEIIKYNNRLQSYEDRRQIENELVFVRRKIDEVKQEIIQLENNLAFFSNASESNPLVQDVYKKIEKHKSSLESWKQKLQQVKSMI